MNDIEFVDGVAVMDSRAIAAATEKEHKHVIRDVVQMVANFLGKEDGPVLDHDLPKGIRVEREARGYVSRYLLDRSWSYTLVAGYRVDLRKAIIDRWEALETGKALPKSKTSKLPNGVQLHEIRVMAEKRVLTSRQVARLLGVDDPEPQTTPREPVKYATPEEVEKALIGITEFSPRAKRAAVGVARRIQAREDERKTTDRLNGHLF